MNDFRVDVVPSIDLLEAMDDAHLTPIELAVLFKKLCELVAHYGMNGFHEFTKNLDDSTALVCQAIVSDFRGDVDASQDQ